MSIRMSLNSKENRTPAMRIPTGKYYESPTSKLRYSTSKIYPKHKSQVQIFQDILFYTFNQSETEIEICINKLTSKELRQKFKKLNELYNYKNYRKDNLTFKINSFNDILKEMASQELVNPAKKLMKDDIKEFDRASLERVIRLTNDSKIYTKLMKGKGEHFGVSEAMNFVTAESLPSMSELSNLKNEYQLIKSSLKFEQQQKLKKQVLWLKAMVKQMQGQKYNLMNHMVEQDKMKDITAIKCYKQERQKGANVNSIPTNKKISLENQPNRIRFLVEVNQSMSLQLMQYKELAKSLQQTKKKKEDQYKSMSLQLMQYKERVESLQQTIKNKEDQYCKLKSQTAKAKAQGKHQRFLSAQEIFAKDEDELTNHQNQYQQQHNENQQKQSTLDNKIKLIDQLVSKFENTQKIFQLEYQASEIKRLSAQIDKVKQQRQKQIEEVATQIKQIPRLKQQLTEQIKRLSQKRGDITILQKIKMQLQKQMKQKQEQIAQLKSQINQLKQENIQTLTQQQVKLSRQLRQNEKLIKQFIAEQGSTKQQIKRLNKTIEEQNIQQIEMKNLLAKAEKQYQLIQQLKSEKPKSFIKFTYSQKKAVEIQTTVSGLKNEIEQFEAIQISSQNLMTQYQSKIQNQDKKLQQNQKWIENCRFRIEILEEEQKNLRDQINQMTFSIENLREENNSLRQQNDPLSRKNKQLESVSQELTDGNQLLRTQKVELERAIEGYKQSAKRNNSYEKSDQLDPQSFDYFFKNEVKVLGSQIEGTLNNPYEQISKTTEEKIMSTL